jgi:hypothetical protein
MTAVSEAPRRDLGGLAEALVKAADRAADVQSAQSLAADYEGLRHRIDEAAGAIGSRMAVLSSRVLAATDEELAAVAEAREGLGDLVAAVRTAVADDPAGLRRGNLWRQADGAISALTARADETIDQAFSRLIRASPAPEPGLLAAVPPATPGIDEYRAATARYEELVAVRPRSGEALDGFLALTGTLAELEQRLVREAVPAEFRAQWQQLQRGELRLASLDDAFHDWLRDRGMLEGVVLLYRAA